MIEQHFHTTVSPIKEIFQKELEMRKVTRSYLPHSPSPVQKVARVEASKAMLRIRQKSEVNHIEGIATGDEFWFRYFYPSSTMFARSPAEIILRTRQAIGAKRTMITIFSLHAN
jgi:hypothetical protein